MPVTVLISKQDCLEMFDDRYKYASNKVMQQKRLKHYHNAKFWEGNAQAWRQARLIVQDINVVKES